MIGRISSVVSALIILIVFWACTSYPPLLKAAYDGDLAGVRASLNDGRDVNMTVGRLNETALMLAAGQGHPDTVKYLLDHGADVSQLTRNGESALIRATWGCNPDIARLLIARGADVNIKNQDYGMTPLMFAVNCRDIKLVKFLIESGADITAEDRAGVSLLMMAVWQNSAELVETLIDAGLDVKAAQSKETSPLYEAAFNGFDSVIPVLAEKGGDINFKAGGYGWTPLMIATAQNHFSTVSALIKAGADINAKDHSGYTALMVAAFYSNAAIAGILCENGADVNAQDSGGLTALHLASSNQDEESAAILLLHHASVTAKDKKGHDALWYAQKERNAKIVSMLENPDPAIIASMVPAAVANAIDRGRIDKASIENVRSALPLGRSYSTIVFHRFDLPEQLKKDYPDAAIRCEQSAMAHLKQKNVYKNVKAKIDPPYGNNTVLVDGIVEDIYYAGTGKRIILGPIAGIPFMEVRIRLTDAESQTVIREKVISTIANIWFASATMGTSDKYLPDRMGEIIGEYLYTIIPAGPVSD